MCQTIAKGGKRCTTAHTGYFISDREKAFTLSKRYMRPSERRIETNPFGTRTKVEVLAMSDSEFNTVRTQFDESKATDNPFVFRFSNRGTAKVNPYDLYQPVEGQTAEPAESPVAAVVGPEFAYSKVQLNTQALYVSLHTRDRKTLDKLAVEYKVDSRVFHKISSERENVALRSKSEKDLRILAFDEEVNVRTAVAINENTPPAIKAILMKDPNPYVRKMATNK